jgi:hypothetical protein
VLALFRHLDIKRTYWCLMRLIINLATLYE